jgi:hypothetical protein
MRRANHIKKSNDVLILTNGERTEKVYFTLLKQKVRSYYSIHVKFENKDPYRLVKSAIEWKNQYAFVWIVFDIDLFLEQGHVQRAYDLANQHKSIYIACSNKAFEVWLINHFRVFHDACLINQYKIYLEDAFQTTKIKQSIYDKADTSLFSKHIIPRYRTAIHNARLAYQIKVVEFQSLNGNVEPHIWDLHSATTVFQLVDKLFKK